MSPSAQPAGPGTPAPSPRDILLVLSNLPSRELALSIGEQMVGAGLAACVNLLAPCVSMYRWEGRVQRDEEHPMLLKTTRARYPELEAALRAAHPYEVPEIIAVPLAAGLPDYLAWVEKMTESDISG